MRIGIGAVTLLALSAVLALSPIASADDQTAQQTINDLQSQGYTVKIDRIGTGSMDGCVVTSVRNPHEFIQWMPLVGPVLGTDAGNVLIPVTTSKTVNVSLVCNG